MNKRYCIDIKEVPVEDKKKKETSPLKPFSIKMFILTVIVSLFLFPNMWREWGMKNYRFDSPTTQQK